MRGAQGRGVEGGAAEASWRSTELDIVGGAAHALNSSLTGLTLAAEMARMDEGLCEGTLEVIEQQSTRLQSEVELLFALLALERTTPQLHNPLELARSAERLFRRLPAAIRGDVRITGTPDAGAVELDAGPCVRAVVLCMRAFAAAFEAPGIREIELEVHSGEGTIDMTIRCGDDAIAPAQEFLDVAAELLGPGCGATLATTDRRVTLLMQTPRR